MIEKFKSLLYIRDCTMEPSIKTALIRAYPSEYPDALVFAPIGLDEPYRIIVANNHVNLVRKT